MTTGHSNRDTSRERGVVAWFHEARGFGFVTSCVDGRPVFVSHRDLSGTAFRTLEAGDEVRFTPSIDEHGPVAVGVFRCTSAAADQAEAPISSVA